MFYIVYYYIEVCMFNMEGVFLAIVLHCYIIIIIGKILINMMNTYVWFNHLVSVWCLWP